MSASVGRPVSVMEAVAAKDWSQLPGMAAPAPPAAAPEPAPTDTPAETAPPTAEDGSTVVPFVDEVDAAPVKKKRDQSEFCKLRNELQTGVAVATFAEQWSERLKSPKELSIFLQTISGRDEALYEDLFTNFKPQVAGVIERIFNAYTSSIQRREDKKAPKFASKSKKRGRQLGNATANVDQATNTTDKLQLPAQTHEFLIRAMYHGVMRSTWADGIDFSTTKQFVEPLLTVKEMLKTLAKRDVLGRTQRAIELLKKPEGMEYCFVVLNAGMEHLVPQQQSFILGRLLSKLRRLEGLTTEQIATVIDFAHGLIMGEKKVPCPGKLQGFLGWVGEDDTRIPDGYIEKIGVLLGAFETGVETQTTQLETLVMVKGIDADEEGAGEELEGLVEVLASSWPNGAPSVDIVSALAVKATTFPPKSSARVAAYNYLVSLSEGALSGKMPRRAHAFIAKERSALKKPRVEVSAPVADADGAEEPATAVDVQPAEDEVEAEADVEI